MVARYYDGNVGRFNSVDTLYLAIGNSKLFNEIINKDKKKENKTAIERIRVNNPNDNKNYRNDYEMSQRMKNYLANLQSLNSYSYANNNPLKLYDPSGNFAVLAAPLVIPVGEAIIAAAGAATAAVTGYLMSQNISWDPGRQILPNLGLPDGKKLLDPQNLNNPKTPKWLKWVIGGAIAVERIIDTVKDFKDAKQNYRQMDTKIQNYNKYKDGPVWRSDPRKETIRANN